MIYKEGIFVGANKQSFVNDYNVARKTVAFGAANNVALWKPLDEMGIYSTLKNHTKEVTGVKFVPNTPFLVTVAEDDLINVWIEKGPDEYAHFQTLEFHNHSITCLAIVNEKVFVTGSADGSIALWIYGDNQFSLGHSFQVSSSFYPLALVIQDISENDYILAVSGTSSNIFVYTFKLETAVLDFSQSAVLSGHEDWVRCLQFVTDSKYKNYVLASGAQDRYIRLWRLRINELIDDSDEDELKLVLLSNKQYKFNFGSSRGAINFEALIMGHDDWVTSLQWNPRNRTGLQSKLQLLSSSADTALMIWEMDIDSGIWCCVSRLGEMSIKGASTATGASGGFWSSLWIINDDDNSHYILASGKTGAIRVYKSIDSDAKTFESVLGVTGAVGEITDLSWALNGKYFTATSLDQTARLYAPWTVGRDKATWHEFARPQIHGYDMICMDNINASKYVSGGDEKILRVFEITHSISKLLKNLCEIDVSVEQLPESASLPVLGLSNKAANEQLEAGEGSPQDEEEPKEKEDVLAALTTPPLEDHLQRYTLFPELEKLYGHGYEITCCATSPNGALIASACRSNSAKHAVIRIFDASKDYQQCSQVLEGHNLTITSLEFSPDGKHLLAVSRDRQFSLWEVTGDHFELVELNTKAHTRIIWDCSWAPTTKHGSFFVTGSRDKQIKLWSVNSGVHLETSFKLNVPITSVSCYKAEVSDKVVVAVGLEDGGIEIYTVDLAHEKRFDLVVRFDDDITPADRVSKLSFSNQVTDKYVLAVGSNDTSVRIYSIDKI